ncbi:MAG: hypothetical protein AB7I33_00820 [Gemmatimonadales bacterium]
MTFGDEPRLQRLFRLAILSILLLGLLGTVVELLLLEHWDGVWQYLPFILIGIALGTLGWHGLRPGRFGLIALRLVMILFLLGGVAGVLLHYRGNVEFELERSPGLGGFALFKEAMMGATPALAPGMMIQLGLLGLLYTFRHPAFGTGPRSTSRAVPEAGNEPINRDRSNS